MLPIDSYESFTRHLGDREYFGQKLGLERMQALMKRLGHPEKTFPSIHIAGTNGKGSTAAMVASILKEAGYRVGLYTSPHLIDFCERIQILEKSRQMGIFITPKEVLHYARGLHEVEEEALTFFEMATAMAFLYFAEKKPDFAIIETGLGGRLDATNVIDPLLSVITTISLDHVAHLGGTIEEIAFEKAGIIKPGVPVVTGPLAPQAMEVIREVASSRKTSCLPITRILPPALQVGLAGEHQRRNAMLAMAVALALEEFGGAKVPVEAVENGLARVSWPGRLETLQDLPWILLDGAHNPEAMSVLASFLEERLHGRRLKVLFGAMVDKDLAGLLSEMGPLAEEFFFAELPLQRAALPGDLVRALESSGFKRPSTVFENVGFAMENVIEDLDETEVFLITGSFFLVGEVKRWFQGK